MFLEESIIAKITEAASVKICSWLISQNLKGEDVLSYSFFLRQNRSSEATLSILVDMLPSGKCKCFYSVTQIFKPSWKWNPN